MQGVRATLPGLHLRESSEGAAVGGSRAGTHATVPGGGVSHAMPRARVSFLKGSLSPLQRLASLSI